jgi:putative Mg2+ transporter-C (MgtC) family protein
MSDVDLLTRLIVAASLGAVIGFERETGHRSAGVRTHALVSVGAALFTVAGAYGFSDIPTSTNVDPARVAAQIASGIGFIGAGAIIRHNESVRGITTAATLWLSGALGMAAGAGFLDGAVAATIIVVVVLIGLRAVKTKARQIGSDTWMISVDYERGRGTLGPILRSLDRENLPIERIIIDDEDADVSEPGPRHIELRVRTRDDRAIAQVVAQIGERPEVSSIRLNGLPRDVADS